MTNELRAALDRMMPPGRRQEVLDQARRVALVVSDPAFQRAVEEARRDAEELIELYEESPVAFVVDRLDPALGARLLRADPAQRDALMVGLFEQAMLETDHLDLVEAAVGGSALLGSAQRADIELAVELLRREPVRWGSASRLLLGGYEGSLWRWARAGQIIDDERNVTQRAPGRPGYAKGVDRILEEDGIPLPDEHRRFVRERVFDNLANDIRHGRAEIGHRQCALVVLFALEGWLDEYGGSDLREDASQRMNRLFDDA